MRRGRPRPRARAPAGPGGRGPPRRGRTLPVRPPPGTFWQFPTNWLRSASSRGNLPPGNARGRSGIPNAKEGEAVPTPTNEERSLPRFLKDSSDIQRTGPAPEVPLSSDSGDRSGPSGKDRGSRSLFFLPLGGQTAKGCLSFRFGPVEGCSKVVAPHPLLVDEEGARGRRWRRPCGGRAWPWRPRGACRTAPPRSPAGRASCACRPRCAPPPSHSPFVPPPGNAQVALGMEVGPPPPGRGVAGPRTRWLPPSILRAPHARATPHAPHPPSPVGRAGPPPSPPRGPRGRESFSADRSRRARALPQPTRLAGRLRLSGWRRPPLGPAAPARRERRRERRDGTGAGPPAAPLLGADDERAAARRRRRCRPSRR